MILQKIRLHPFAGATDRSVVFTPGLNVVLGPNEAGKSTLVDALKNALFQPVALPPAKFRDTMQRFMPLTGGDTVRVSLIFRQGAGEYELQKSWGGTRMARLRLPEGGELTASEKVEDALAKLLRLGRGTYDNVLFTYQAHLAKTLDELRGSIDARSSLSDILRQTLYTADGVSIERLQERLSKIVADYYDHWDNTTGSPERGHGIENPWLKNVGYILEAYYAVAKREAQYQKAMEYELGIDAFAKSIGVIEAETENLAAYVQDNAQRFEDARIRIDLENNLERVSVEVKDLKLAQREWPRVEERMIHLGKEVDGLRAQYSTLHEEHKAAQGAMEQQALRSRFAQATILHDELATEETKLKTMRDVPSVSIAVLRKAEQDLAKVETKLESHKLDVSFTARKAITLTLNGGKDGPKQITLGGGESHRESAGGEITLEHEDWVLQVRAGDENASNLVAKRKTAREALDALLVKFDVKSAEDAEARHGAWALQESAVTAKRKALASLTGPAGYAVLAAEIEKLGPAAITRPLDSISREKDEKKEEGILKAAELKSLKAQCDQWKEKYVSQDSLLDLFARRSGEERGLRDSIAKLNPLPEGISDGRAFIKEFEKRKASLEAKRKELFDIKLSRKEFEKQEPGISREDLADLLAAEKKKFEETKAKGKAYLRIQKEFQRLLGELDGATFQPLQHRLERLLESLTDRRYRSLEMKESLPTGVGGESITLGLGQLSAGMVDVLALTVRLGMAEYYLQGEEGFVIFDDPLVNLDPDRQEAAARCIREFAKEKQTIVLTCHPSHARILGGTAVELEKTPR